MPLPWLLSLCSFSNVDVPWASGLGLLLSAPAQPLSVISLMPGLQLPSVADNNPCISIWIFRVSMIWQKRQTEYYIYFTSILQFLKWYTYLPFLWTVHWTSNSASPNLNSSVLSQSCSSFLLQESSHFKTETWESPSHSRPLTVNYPFSRFLPLHIPSLHPHQRASPGPLLHSQRHPNIHPFTHSFIHSASLTLIQVLKIHQWTQDIKITAEWT